ncbi:T9SS type A sorting domain-containing protein [Flavobacterium caeni]|uniref:Por secretion system C-terminal sorting domain-containing protein n=1 Tax=Flavobacterium caeni TaxID=490189 RepID=A0A1G5BC73_9FLAO|nr:T9SS type A sorting domain-containing protein [Flavobacterium caeni]SCX87743.1 Por secretion system C-terminal sorting domain-containing protein [Flavobacterium caeni]
MKKSLHAFAVVFLWMFATGHAQTWNKLAGFNDANAAVWMDAGTSTNYAITADRWIYHCDNNATEWIPFVNVPATYTVGTIKASKVSNRVFCLTSTSGIAYTDNFGATWQSNNLGGGNGGQSGSGPYLLAYALNGAKVLASTMGAIMGEIQNKLFLSNDNGVTYSQLANLGFYPTGFHFVNESEVLSNASNGIFKTTDLNSWVSIGFDGLEVTDLEVSGTQVFASVMVTSGNGKVYKSNDSGLTWNELSGLPVNNGVSKLAYDAVHDRLFATTKSGVCVYADNTWSVVSALNKAHEIIVTGNQSVLFSGVRINGIHKINANDLAVQQINNGLLIPSDMMAVSSDDQLYTGSLQTSFLSKLDLTNLEWTSQTLFEEIDFTRNLSMGIASDGQCVVGGLHFIGKTANQGNSFSIIADDNTAPLAPVYDMLNPQKMFLGNNGSIAMVQHALQDYVDYSPDMGATWQHLYENNGTNPGLLGLTKICSGTQTHFILGMSNLTAQPVVLASDSVGGTWVALPNPNNTLVRDIFVDKFNTLYAVTQSGLYRLNPGSATWTPLNIDLGLEGNKVVEVKFNNSNQLHVLIRTTTTPFAQEGLYIPNETETAFTQVPLPVVDGNTIPLKNLSFSGSNIPLAMTNLAVHDFENEGIYYFSDAPFLAVNQVKTVDDLRVFPNPASGQVNVVSKNAPTSAHLVSMTGQVIPVLISNGKFDVSTIASGFYVLQLNGNNQASHQKLVVAH